jgi:dolichol-phosphate hexosyltransferase
MSTLSKGLQEDVFGEKVKQASQISKIKTKISIVIPALNEAEGIKNTINNIPTRILTESGYETQILVIDNGSSDGTGEIARNSGADVITEKRRGYGRAYKTGFALARGDIIVTLDADGTYPVEDIPELVKILVHNKLDFLTTNRLGLLEKGAMPLRNKIGNGVLNLTTKILFNIHVKDSQSGMWVFKKDILNKMVLKSDNMAFSEELKIEACHYVSCRWQEIPIKYKGRIGRPKLNAWRDGLRNLRYLVSKKIMR